MGDELSMEKKVDFLFNRVVNMETKKAYQYYYNVASKVLFEPFEGLATIPGDFSALAVGLQQISEDLIKLVDAELYDKYGPKQEVEYEETND